ncbi:S-adenosylmethionine decarboxylase [Candidatus Micrarchaeota archaeon]|nr:S-adenosylmethionine decarboxylase [Candidatus Micrarchaeota archaeon]MBU1166406.1 S-adenosylmethionine decarboxylase [Candidatus Micrarchaeota archaeon]MBU1886911.1 S-adenosylmethionine decarboxylase [Candidatus Micrarchaeota archaeon]
MKLQHIHLTVNAKISPAFKELPRDDAQRLVDELMKRINMKPLGPLNWATAEDLEFPGQSFVQMITTSHCSLHLFADTNEVYFDLYSCKEFDEKEVVGLLDETFGISEWHGMLYTRATGNEPEVKRIGSGYKEKLTLKATN